MLAACPAYLTLLYLIILMHKGRDCNKSDKEIRVHDSKRYLTTNGSIVNVIYYFNICKL
jgi:hypothetical protein